MPRDSEFIWMEGEFVPYEKAQIHILSHSLHYGCAPFEGIRAYQTAAQQTALYRADSHYDRLHRSMKFLGYPTRYSTPQLLAATKELIRKNKFKECYIRPIAYINDTVRGLKLPKEPEVLVAIAVWPWGKYMGDDGFNKGVRVKFCTQRRPENPVLCQAKISGNYLVSVLARREATLDGFDEAILLDTEGFVAEGSGENIFVVKNGKISTPRLDYVLCGITRDSTMKIAKHLGLEVTEENISKDELLSADEIFFTGTAAEVTPIREIGGQPIGEGKPGPIARKICEVFLQTTRGEVPEFQSWIDPV